jgi:hypothetical protein
MQYLFTNTTTGSSVAYAAIRRMRNVRDHQRDKDDLFSDK